MCKNILLLVVIYSLNVLLISGEIRCYCNQAACVTTGYMCKSKSFCFSDLESGMHGCLDRRRCSGLHCCKEDMCNYMHIDIHSHINKAPMTGKFSYATSISIFIYVEIYSNKVKYEITLY